MTAEGGPPKGWEVGGKYREDPKGAHRPRGKDTSRRKHARDPGLTPSEKYLKDKLMRQFMKTGEGDGGHSAAWRDSEVWCDRCGFYFKAEDAKLCRRCLEAAVDLPEWRP